MTIILNSSSPTGRSRLSFRTLFCLPPSKVTPLDLQNLPVILPVDSQLEGQYDEGNQRVPSKNESEKVPIVEEYRNIDTKSTTTTPTVVDIRHNTNNIIPLLDHHHHPNYSRYPGSIDSDTKQTPPVVPVENTSNPPDSEIETITVVPVSDILHSSGIATEKDENRVESPTLLERSEPVQQRVLISDRTTVSQDKVMVPPDVPNDFSAAGCSFQNDSHVLCGYQPYKQGITGIGGKREGTENVLETAFRETIEELFNIDSVPRSLIDICIVELVPQRIIHMGGGYYNLVLNLEDQLPYLLALCAASRLETTLYPENQVPDNLIDLLYKRRKNVNMEVESLALLPIVRKASPKRDLVDRQFTRDMKKL